MEHKVVPFRAQVSNNGTRGGVAQQVYELIQSEVDAGWEFVSCGNINAVVEGSNGCFGFGARPASNTTVMVLIFRQ